MNSIDMKLKYTKNRIYRALILQMVCLVFLFTGYSIYALDECEYSYYIYKFPGAEKINYSCAFDCSWNSGDNSWRVTPAVHAQEGNRNYRKTMWFNDEESNNSPAKSQNNQSQNAQ